MEKTIQACQNCHQVYDHRLYYLHLLQLGDLSFLPALFIHMFNSEPQLLSAGVPAMRIYFFGIFMMALQFAGQSTFVALGKSNKLYSFHFWRKAIIVIPLTLLLPELWGLGTNGVFLAEPVSNFIGGTASFATMLITVWPTLKDKRY